MKKKLAQEKYFIKGKDTITDPNAPVISNEFVDKQPEGVYQGGTIEVQSDTHLEDDLGIGEPFVLRTFTFALNPQVVKQGLPSNQEIFNQFKRGIESILWGDGLSPATELEPKMIISRNKKYVFIQVWSRPRLGQVLAEQTKTLSQIIRESRTDKNKV